MSYSYWTPKEIEFLRKSFAQATPIKIIAATLNRSMTSVNKMISRCGIRQEHPRRTLSQRPTPKVKKANAVIRVRHLTTPCVDLSTIVTYLRNQNIPVRCTQLTPRPIFKIGLEPKTPGQLLYLYNKLRLDHGLDVIHAYQVTNA